MSTYSPSLRIELIATGDQAGTWGNTTNVNLGGLIKSAIAGYVSVSITSANQALTALNGAPDQSRNQAIALTTTTTAAFNVYAPPAEKTYVIYNASAYAATLFNSTVLGNPTAAGLGVTIPAGKTVTVWSDGTNFAFQNDHLPSLTLATDLAIADGGTGASTAQPAQGQLQQVLPSLWLQEGQACYSRERICEEEESRVRSVLGHFTKKGARQQKQPLREESAVAKV